MCVEKLRVRVCLVLGGFLVLFERWWKRGTGEGGLQILESNWLEYLFLGNLVVYLY